MRVFIIEKAVTTVFRLSRITLYLKTLEIQGWNMGEVIPAMQMQSDFNLSNTTGTASTMCVLYL